MHQEQNSLVRIGDSFKKIIVVKDHIKPWRNEEGILVMGIMDFSLKSGQLRLVNEKETGKEWASSMNMSWQSEKVSFKVI